MDSSQRPTPPGPPSPRTPAPGPPPAFAPLAAEPAPSPAPTAPGPTNASPVPADPAAPAPPDLSALAERVRDAGAWVPSLLDEVGRVVVGQEGMVERLLIGLLTGGHVLLEGVPGLAKTLTISTLARAVHADFQRIQFTPDLLPADLIGTLIYHQGDGSFHVKKGPVFANFVLADEVNRAPAKVQSALLEAMQEKQVTIGDATYTLPRPFLVLATQNPIEQEGTYPLPEAQVDRFMLKTVVGYPSREDELVILRRMARTAEAPPTRAVVTPEAILKAREVVDAIWMDPSVEEYIVDLVLATRSPGQYRVPGLDGLVAHGASPRATIALALASRATAFLDGRAYVTPDDVRAIALDVLRHRVGVTYEAEAEEVTSDQIVGRVLERVEVP